jgi:hypothetical protein
MHQLKDLIYNLPSNNSKSFILGCSHELPFSSSSEKMLFKNAYYYLHLALYPEVHQTVETTSIVYNPMKMTHATPRQKSCVY